MKPSTDQKTTLTLLDIAGSCITDVFYNHLYDRAIAVHEKTSKGLTECYRQAINNYIAESNSPKFFSLMINSIHHYTRMSTIYTDLSYTDCISLYAGLFVPEMFVGSITIDQKVNIISMILGNVVRAFAEDILQQHITVIIDDHSDPLNIEILQDVILKQLLKERESSYDKFIQCQKPAKGASSEVRRSKKKLISQTQSAAPKAMVKITNAYKKSITDRVALKKQNAALQHKNKVIMEKFDELKRMFLDQISFQKQQSKVIDNLKLQMEKSMHQHSGRTSSSETTTQEIELPIVSQHSNKANEDYADDEDDEQLFSVQYVET